MFPAIIVSNVFGVVYQTLQENLHVNASNAAETSSCIQPSSAQANRRFKQTSEM